MLVVASGVLVSSLACHSSPPGEPTTLAVTGVSPMSASFFAAERVVVNGAGFRRGATVTFGGIPAPVVGLTATQIIVTTPPSPVGTVDVVVTNPNGEQTRVQGFEFLDFQVSAIEPGSGLPVPFITVRGAGFRLGARVVVGGETARIRSVDSRRITLDGPFLTAGTYDVEVITAEGRSIVKPAAFEYVPVTIRLDDAVVSPGSIIRASWLAPADRFAFLDFGGPGDLLVLARAGDPDSLWLWDHEPFIETGTVNVAAPALPGDYEFRYLIGRRRYTHAPLTVTSDRD